MKPFFKTEELNEVESIWSNYTRSLTRPISLKWWFSKGNGTPVISVKSRLVKYYNLARMMMNLIDLIVFSYLVPSRKTKSSPLLEDELSFWDTILSGVNSLLVSGRVTIDGSEI